MGINLLCQLFGPGRQLAFMAAFYPRTDTLPETNTETNN